LSYGPAIAGRLSPAGTCREPCLAMLRVLPAGRTVLPNPQPIRIVAPVLIARIVPVAALRACKPEPSVVNSALPRHVRLPSLPTPWGQDKASRAALPTRPARLIQPFRRAYSTIRHCLRQVERKGP